MRGVLKTDPPAGWCSAGCRVRVAAGRVFCPECWERVPDDARDAIAAAWRPGVPRFAQPTDVRRAIGRAVREVWLVTSNRAAL